MKNRDGLCEAEVKKNLVLAEIGEPLTLPLARLNRSCEFRKEWNRIQKIWNHKKIIYICNVCSNKFTANKKRSHCSEKCRIILELKRKKAYRERPEVKEMLKSIYTRYQNKPEVRERMKKHAKAYRQRPGVKTRLKAYRQRPEVKARNKNYYKNNREDILKKLKIKYSQSKA